MTDQRTDAQLVHDHLAGDPSALAAMFDRFAPGLFDTAAAMTRDRHDAADLVQDVFVMTAERLGQLREPDRLKAWMYAVLRNEVYRRTKKRSRVRPTDFGSPDVPEMAAPLDPQADAEMVAYTELAELVRAAAGGLDERDQLMLELSVRQGLQGADLAAAMGVTPEQSYTLVHRMRDRVERALGALVVARAGRRDCAELATILGAWNGEFTILIRKRVARHVDACDTCTRTRAKAAPIALLGAAPAMAMPVGLRERVLGAASAPTPTGAPTDAGRHGYSFDGPGGFPGLVRTGTRAVAWFAGAAAVLFIALGGAIMWQSTRAGEPALVTATTAAAIETIAIATTEPDADTTSPAPTSGPTTSAPRSTTTTIEPTTTSTPAVAAPVTTTPANSAPTTAGPTTPATTVPGVFVPTTPTAAPTTTTPAVTTTEPRRTTTTSTTVAPGRLTLSTNVIDLGGGSTGVVTVTNTGGSPVDWSIRGSATPFSLGATPGTLAPGAQSTITVTFLRDRLAEGNYAATVTVIGGGTTSLTMLAKVNRAPGVDITGVNGCIEPSVSAVVSDESSVTVMLGWFGPENGTAAMSLRNGVWIGRAPVQTEGVYTFTVQATDAFGNTGSDVASANVTYCIG